MKYKRILLKLSGEALVGDKAGGIDPEILIKYSNEIKKIYDKGVEIAIVIGGGTSLVKGFLDVFNEQFDQTEFPIPVSEIVLIEDAHTAVARGCLSEAQLIEEDDE